MADTFDLDLDALDPKPKQVKLGGKLFEVYPPKLGAIIALTRLMKELQDVGEDTEKALVAIESIRKAVEPIIPGLKDETHLDLSIDQVSALLEFVFKMATPPEAQELEKKGIEPGSTEKKSSDIAESSPTS